MRFDEIEPHTHKTYDRIMDAITKAHAVGTFNAIDRSKQYANPDHAEMLRALNEAWSKIRRIETLSDEKDVTIRDLKDQLGKKLRRNRLWNTALICAWEIIRTALPYLPFLAR